MPPVCFFYSQISSVLWGMSSPTALPWMVVSAKTSLLSFQCTAVTNLPVMSALQNNESFWSTLSWTAACCCFLLSHMQGFQPPKDVWIVEERCKSCIHEDDVLASDNFPWDLLQLCLPSPSLLCFLPCHCRFEAYNSTLTLHLPSDKLYFNTTVVNNTVVSAFLLSSNGPLPELAISNL